MENLISGKPDMIQFAKDGKYESAWKIMISDGRPTAEEIQSYLDAEEFNDLIVEYLWKSRDGENANVMTLFHNENMAVESNHDFINFSLDAFYDYTTFGDFKNYIDKRIIGFDFLFKSPVDVIRIGILNHWFSVGPVDLWKRGEVRPTLDQIRQKVLSNPKLNPSALNYQSLAFIFNFDKKLRGPYYVLKAPCSKKTESGWEVDFEKTEHYINSWLDIFNRPE